MYRISFPVMLDKVKHLAESPAKSPTESREGEDDEKGLKQAEKHILRPIRDKTQTASQNMGE